MLVSSGIPSFTRSCSFTPSLKPTHNPFRISSTMSKVSSDAVDTAPPSYATDINGPTMTSVDCSAPAHTQGESNYSPAGFVPLPQQTYPQQQAYQQPSYDNRTTAAPAFQQAGSYQNQQSNGPQQSQSCYHPSESSIYLPSR